MTKTSVPAKGVVIAFDQAVLDGAEILYATTKKFLSDLDKIPFDDRIEAEHFSGRDALTALTAYFRQVKTKKTAPKAAKDLGAAYALALNAAAAKAITPSFRNFIKTLTERRVKVVIATRADLLAVTDAFAGLHGQYLPIAHVDYATYGSMAIADWRRLCERFALSRTASVAVAGSGNGVRASFRAGLTPVLVPHERTAYQDCGVTEEIFPKLDTAAAKRILKLLHLD